MKPAVWGTDPDVPNLDAAVEQVARSVEFAKGRIWGGFPDEGFLIATAAMNHVVWGVSSLVWSWQVANDVPLPPCDAEAALASHAGLCGYSAVTFAAIVNRFGLSVRSVQFYWNSRFGARNHIACEVIYDADWRFFDPTWGAFYHEQGIVLGIDQARAGRGELLRDQTLLFNLLDESWGELDYLTDPDTRVELGAYALPRGSR